MVSEIWNRRKEAGGEGGLPKGEVSCRHPPQIPQRGSQVQSANVPLQLSLEILILFTEAQELRSGEQSQS